MSDPSALHRAATRVVLVGLLAVFAAACARPSLYFPPPAEPLLAAPQLGAGPAIVLFPMEDARRDRELDEKLAEGARGHLNEILDRELQSTGLFSAVGDPDMGSTGDAPSIPGGPLELRIELTKLRWHFPNYDQMLRKAFVTSFLTPAS